jgi:hypothetical protein
LSRIRRLQHLPPSEHLPASSRGAAVSSRRVINGFDRFDPASLIDMLETLEREVAAAKKRGDQILASHLEAQLHMLVHHLARMVVS